MRTLWVVALCCGWPVATSGKYLRKIPAACGIGLCVYKEIRLFSSFLSVSVTIFNLRFPNTSKQCFQLFVPSLLPQFASFVPWTLPSNPLIFKELLSVNLGCYDFFLEKLTEARSERCLLVAVFGSRGNRRPAFVRRFPLFFFIFSKIQTWYLRSFFP